MQATRRAAGEATILSLLNRINSDALQARAETLRCKPRHISLPAPDKAYYNFSIVGGRNYHASIVFEDGVTRLARFRLPNHNDPPVEERNFDRRSEYATYNYLAQATVLVPKVFEVADDNDPHNPVGAGYILFEKIRGNPMDWELANESQKNKVCEQLADIYIKLENQPLNKLGHLQPSSSDPTSSFEVGPAFFAYGPTGKLNPVGPFTSSTEYYTALLKYRLNLVKTREIATTAPVDQYLVFRTLLENFPTV